MWFLGGGIAILACSLGFRGVVSMTTLVAMVANCRCHVTAVCCVR